VLVRIFRLDHRDVHEWGYGGIVVMMAVESTIPAVPSERRDPAGYPRAGEDGSVRRDVLRRAREPVGASLNYGVSMCSAADHGAHRAAYVFVTPEKLDAADRYFAKHGRDHDVIGRRFGHPPAT